MEKLDPMVEVLLTAWACWQERDAGAELPTLKQLFPPRLASALRKARKLEYVVIDKKDGPWIDEPGTVFLHQHGYHRPFTVPSGKRRRS